MRINKYLSQLGICSRRKADEWILEGRISINDQPAKTGDQVGPQDRVCLDGSEIRAQAPTPKIWAYYKPRGVECSMSSSLSTGHSDNNLGTALAKFQIPDRLVHIGRLDRDSEGLLLLTNHPELHHRLAHPRFSHEKEYQVWINRPLDMNEMQTLRSGIVLDGIRLAPCQIQAQGTFYQIILGEGRNRQIRRMMESVGARVMRLVRVRFHTQELSAMKSGELRELSSDEFHRLTADSELD